MDQEGKFYFGVWLLVAVAFLGTVFSITYYNLQTNKVWADSIVQATKNGADPIATMCAIKVSTDTVCAITAAKK